MNRTLALLIPAVLLAGMALIIFQQMNGSENLEPVSINSLSSQNNASLLGGAENAQTGQQTGIVSPPAGLATGAQQNATPPVTSAQTDAPAATDPNTSTTRSELGRLADAQEAQANKNPQNTNQNEPQTTTQAGSKPAGTTSPSTVATGETETKPAGTKPTETKPTEAATQADLPKHSMQSMSFKYQGSEILFVMKASEHFEYKTFLLPSPDRLVIDLSGAWTGLDVPNVPSNRLVKGLRLGKLEKGHRIVLDLKEVPKGYETSRDGNTVTVRIY